MQPIHGILEQYWGYTAFRPLQEEIITAVLEGRDVLALLPTGGGKSLCYQVPALAVEGCTLVISPLIALMQDQVQRLEKQGIPAVYIHAGMGYREVKRVLTEVQEGGYKLLYISPERLQSTLFGDYLPELDINLVAVDEAHCISQWGHDFRPDYLRIGMVREMLPGVPVLALTASATKFVQEDIVLQLQLKTPAIFRQSFLRTNLHYNIRYTENKPVDTLIALRRYPDSLLVYCRSRKQTELLSNQLNQRGMPALAYHAGMDKEKRAAAQDEWMNSQVRTMVATTAFGMGIDKPDVRLVLHYDAPEHLEAWYQEAGRAGRDGQPSAAITLFNASDIQRLEESTALQFPPESFLRQVYQAVCDYLQVPTGAQPDRYFDFDLADFCRKFKLPALRASHALRLLNQEGLWTLTDSVFHPTRIRFSADRQTLDSLYERHPDIAYFCTGLLRLYGNMFHYPMAVREQVIARRLHISAQQVQQMLQRLQAMDMLDYEPAKDGPQLLFHHLRVPADHLHIDLARIARLRKQHEIRTKAMIRFLENQDECRNKLLLRYFGEKVNNDCGLCDVCDKQQQKPVSFALLQKEVLEILSGRPEITIDQLPSQLSHDVRKEDVISLIRQMVDEGIVTLMEQGSIRLL